jgi:succinoglycan biosynthesis protein ExoM
MPISLCIATYRRPERLASLLADLVVQTLLPEEIVIVDNDPKGSARAVVEARRARGAPCALSYAVEPVQNISLARNRSVALASGEWIAFIDDDERAPPEWLARLAAAAQVHASDCVLGPVVPVVPDAAPRWIRKGRFYDWARAASGTRVAANRLRFGNVLIRACWIKTRPEPFDPRYGQTGGEDGDLLTRLVARGLAVIWCDEAIVYEPVEPGRLSLRWLLLRALRGGQDFARATLLGRYGVLSPLGRMRFVGRALVQAGVAALLALTSVPLGRHRAAGWLIKLAANLGKLSACMGAHYREYRGEYPSGYQGDSRGNAP